MHRSHNHSKVGFKRASALPSGTANFLTPLPSRRLPPMLPLSIRCRSLSPPLTQSGTTSRRGAKCRFGWQRNASGSSHSARNSCPRGLGCSRSPLTSDHSGHSSQKKARRDLPVTRNILTGLLGVLLARPRGRALGDIPRCFVGLVNEALARAESLPKWLIGMRW